ncbi:hypothetical protein VTN31DRAFT_2984 [Thermomyces dupontii]|uniref:uncharacterized protein n=1 Tax=Talaromyces thermophilus TaxID=28565 RepID=UPI00374413A1
MEGRTEAVRFLTQRPSDLLALSSCAFDARANCARHTCARFHQWPQRRLPTPKQTQCRSLIERAMESTTTLGWTTCLKKTDFEICTMLLERSRISLHLLFQNSASHCGVDKLTGFYSRLHGVCLFLVTHVFLNQETWGDRDCSEQHAIARLSISKSSNMAGWPITGRCLTSC